MFFFGGPFCECDVRGAGIPNVQSFLVNAMQFGCVFLLNVIAHCTIYTTQHTQRLTCSPAKYWCNEVQSSAFILMQSTYTRHGYALCFIFIFGWRGRRKCRRQGVCGCLCVCISAVFRVSPSFVPK